MSVYTQETSQKGPQLAPFESPSSRLAMPQVIWRNRWWVLAVFVVCIVGGLTYLLKATPIYNSSCRLYVEKSGPQIITANEGFMTQTKNYLYTQGELLKSTPIISAAVKSLDIRKLKTFDDVTDPVGFLKKELDVEVGKKDDIITASLESPYRHEAAEIVNMLVESYIAYHSRQKRSTTGEVLRILQHEKSKRDAELSGRFQALMDFKRSNETISFGTDDSNIIIKRLVKLSDATTEAELELLEAQSKYEGVKSMLNEPAKLEALVEAPRAIGGSANGMREVDALQSQISKLQLELVSMSQDCTSDHPMVKTAKMQLKQLQSQRNSRLKFLAETQAAALARKCAAGQRKLTGLRESLDSQRMLAQNLNSKAVQYVMLEADLKRTERVCDLLDSRIKEMDVTEDAGVLNISVLEVAEAELLPTRPRKARVMAAAIGMGLLLGAGLALLRNWMDHRLRSADEVTEALGLPVVGLVPHVSGSSDASRIVQTDPTSIAAEAYRTVRTALYFGMGDERAKTVLVTSPSPSDGKTTLTSNLGIAMAQAGQTVLILDADFRRPSQHKAFEIDKDAPGLSDALIGNITLQEAIRSTGTEGLSVLPCGTIPPNPSEALGSGAFRKLLGDLSKQYDFVLLDAPPVMPVTDSTILGSFCDAALLVLRAEKSHWKPSRQAVDALLKVGTQIVGAVVNDVPTKRSGYGYYNSYYSSNYRYYDSGQGGERDHGAGHKRVEKDAA